MTMPAMSKRKQEKTRAGIESVLETARSSSDEGWVTSIQIRYVLANRDGIECTIGQIQNVLAEMPVARRVRAAVTEYRLIPDGRPLLIVAHPDSEELWAAYQARFNAPEMNDNRVPAFIAGWEAAKDRFRVKPVRESTIKLPDVDTL